MSGEPSGRLVSFVWGWLVCVGVVWELNSVFVFVFVCLFLPGSVLGLGVLPGSVLGLGVFVRVSGLDCLWFLLESLILAQDERWRRA